MAANDFRSLGGVPPSNIPLLQDFKAGRADLDEVLSNWQLLHTAGQAVVIVYRSGQASASGSDLVSCMAQEYRLSFALRHPSTRHTLRPPSPPSSAQPILPDTLPAKPLYPSSLCDKKRG